MPDFSNILLATDLDGTFFGSHATMVERNLEAVAYFKAHGGHFIAATGRVCPNIARVIPNAGELFNAPCVTSNGAYIYDFLRGEVLRTTRMDAQKLKALVLEVEAFNPNIGMRVSTDKGFLVDANRLNDMMLSEVNSKHFVGEVIPAEAWDTQSAEWYKMVLRASFEELCQAREVLYPAYADYFEFCSSSPTLFEMQAKGCTKWGGVTYVAHLLSQKLGHPLTIVTIGDQENDLPMLAGAHISACPENALDVVKATAKLQLCHHTQGAVAELIEYLKEYEGDAEGKLP